MIAAKIVDWATIGRVILASLVSAVVISTAFSVLVLAAVRSSEFRRTGRHGGATGFAVMAAVAGAVVIAAVVGSVLVLTTK